MIEQLTLVIPLFIDEFASLPVDIRLTFKKTRIFSAPSTRMRFRLRFITLVVLLGMLTRLRQSTYATALTVIPQGLRLSKWKDIK